MTCPDCASLQAENHRLTEENHRLTQENTDLKRRLAAYENPHTPPSRRIAYPTPRSGTDGPRYPGRPRGHRGSTRPRPRPDMVAEPPRKDKCAGCGAPLGEPSEVSHRIVEEISNPAPRQVIDYLEYGYMCEACGTHTVSRHPDCPPDGRFGKNVLVQATLMKFEERLPHRKVSEALERTYGLQVTPATVLDVTRRVAWWLRPEYTQILERIRSAPVVYVDETGARVDGRRHWIWVFATLTDTLIVVRKRRGKKVLEEVLGKGFKGIIVCDGWKSYPNFTDRIQRCWAHLLREASNLAEHVEEAGPFSEALHGLYRRLNVPPEDKPPPDEAAGLAEEARSVIEAWARRPYEREEVRRFAGKVLNGLDHWFTFLTVAGVEPTNNRAERALREHVVQRKIMGCFRNGKGTWIYETVMTVLASWKQQGRDLPQTLAQTLTQEWNKS
jgi:transposase